MTIVRNIFRFWWVPLAAPLVPVVFVFAGVVNWEMGVLWGGNSEMIPADFAGLGGPAVSVGHFLALFLVALGVFQGVVLHFLAETWRGRDYAMLAGLLFLAVFSIGISSWGGIAWQQARADLMERKGNAVLQDYSQASVEVTRRSAATHKIKPRDAAVIKAEIAAIMSETVWIKKRAHRVGALSSDCSKDHWRTRKACGAYPALAIELAEARAYEKNNSAIDEARELRDASLVIDPAKLYAWFTDLTDYTAEQQKTWRIFGVQLVVELVAVLILPLMQWMARRSLAPTGGGTPHKNGESIAESPANSKSYPGALRVIDGGKAAQAARAGGRFAAADDTSLIEYARARRDTGEMRVHDFMDDYRAFCKGRALKPLGRNVIGTLLTRIGGSKGRVTTYTAAGKQSYRTTWRLTAAAVAERMAA